MEKDLLQTVAGIGKEFPLALLQVVTDQPEDALRRGLAQLQAAEFIYETSLFPDVQYTFTHVLTHEVAYQSLLQKRCRALHAGIVEAIEALYSDRLTEWADRLSHHVVRGEVWSKAPAYFRRSTMSVSSSMDASFWWLGGYNRAIKLGHHDLAVAVDFKNFLLQVTTNFYLGQVYHALGGYPRAIDFLKHNVAALEGDLLRGCFYLPGPASVFSRTWLAWYLSERGESTEGMTHAEEAVQIAETAEHAYGLSVACFGLGSLSLQKREL